MNAAQVVPDYGVISPMYGVAEYGMPYASFSIKGKIRAEEGGAGIPKIKVSATDTSNKITIDSAITQADGSFSMTFEESPALNAWILDVRDVDGVFQRKDTLVSIPRDSLKGGTGFYAGAGSADIELFLTTGTAAIVPDNGSAKMLPKVTASWGKSGAITLRYTLAVQGRTVISLFSVTGKLVREISDTWESSGDHDIQVASAGLTTGAYFLKLQTATHAVITKVLIAR
jgi:putative lipoprotein (rSAM/lipoprotein system)